MSGVKAVFLLGCYGCIFHGTGNSAELCQNFGISGGFEHPKPPPSVRHWTYVNMYVYTGRYLDIGLIQGMKETMNLRMKTKLGTVTFDFLTWSIKKTHSHTCDHSKVFSRHSNYLRPYSINFRTGDLIQNTNEISKVNSVTYMLVYKASNSNLHGTYNSCDAIT